MPDDVDCEKTLLKLNDLKVTDEVEDNATSSMIWLLYHRFTGTPTYLLRWRCKCKGCGSSCSNPSLSMVLTYLPLRIVLLTSSHYSKVGQGNRLQIWTQLWVVSQLFCLARYRSRLG